MATDQNTSRVQLRNAQFLWFVASVVIAFCWTFDDRAVKVLLVLLGVATFVAADASHVCSTLPVRRPRRMPAAGYIVFVLASVVWTWLTLLVVWLGQPHIAQLIAFPGMMHVLAWLMIALLGEAEHRGRARVLAYIFMPVVYPLVLATVLAVGSRIDVSLGQVFLLVAVPLSAGLLHLADRFTRPSVASSGAL